MQQEPQVTQGCMQDVTPFSQPQLHLEQYATGPHIAARMLHVVLPQQAVQAYTT